MTKLSICGKLRGVKGRTSWWKFLVHYKVHVVIDQESGFIAVVSLQVIAEVNMSYRAATDLCFRPNELDSFGAKS